MRIYIDFRDDFVALKIRILNNYERNCIMYKRKNESLLNEIITIFFILDCYGAN